jgi:hypothetical protein
VFKHIWKSFGPVEGVCVYLAGYAW